MYRLHENGLLSTIGGLCAFMVVMGIGRFAFTALLPGMMNVYSLGEDTAGIMAAWNYAGYLVGVIAMRKETPGTRRYLLFVCFLTLSILTTAGMGMVTRHALWHAMRFLAGFASGACFVLCSSIVLDTLAAINRPALAGILYSGVGAGIAMGGAVSSPLELAGGPAGAWFGLAAICLPLALVAVIALRPGANQAPERQTPGESGLSSETRGQKRRYRILLISYFLEGFGYIIGATFLVTLVQTATNSSETARLSWVVTGCAAALSTPVWRYAARKGYAKMLFFAFLLQGAGVLFPVLSNSTIAAMIGGLLLGGTFMGITVLSLQYGVVLSGMPSAHTVAVMTALYGVGQIIGPVVAGLVATEQGFSPAFVISSFSLFIAAGLLLLTNFRKM